MHLGCLFSAGILHARITELDKSMCVRKPTIWDPVWGSYLRVWVLLSTVTGSCFCIYNKNV